MMKKHYAWFLAVAFLAVWFWSWWNAADPHNWLLENELVFFFVPFVIILFSTMRFSRRSLTLITLFMMLHVIGAHYNYGSVPFGVTVGNAFGIHQNEYDKLVHFSFGLLIVYPLWEMLKRLTKTDGFWSYFLAFNLILSWSAFYEIMEWLTVSNVDPHLGYLYIGGNDPFDTQKDMLMAGIGAVLTLVIVGLIRFRQKKRMVQ
jgi:putative membrane protein